MIYVLAILGDQRRSLNISVGVAKFSRFCQTKFLQDFLINEKMVMVNPVFNDKFIMHIELFVKKLG